MKKQGVLIRFFSFLFKLLVVMICMTAIAAATFEGVTRYLTGEFYDLRKIAEKKEKLPLKPEPEDTIENLNSEDIEATLLYVESSDGTSEYITLNLYNTKTKAVDLVLMPEDAALNIDRKLVSELKKKLPDDKEGITLSKIARAYPEEKYDKLTEVIGSLSGLDIAGYDVMTAKRFAAFLNACDHVNFKLDHIMTYRDDENILQGLEPGERTLNGREAVVVLSYLDGTTGQESVRLENVSNYLNTFIGNMGNSKNRERASEAYAKYAEAHIKEGTTSMADILSELTPGKGMVRIMQGGEKNGIYQLDSQKVQLQLSALVKQMEGKQKADKEDSDTESQNAAQSDSRDSSIELYNAAYVSQLATGWKEYLVSEGYNITVLGNYQDEGPISQTRIKVTQEGLGEDLLNYFTNAEITVVDSVTNGGDIAVYIGTDHTDIPTITSEGTTDEDEESEEYEESEESDEEDQSEQSDQDDQSDQSDESGESGDSEFSFDTDSQ